MPLRYLIDTNIIEILNNMMIKFNLHVISSNNNKKYM